MGVTWTLLTYRCCSKQAQIRCWHLIYLFATSLVQKIWIKLILRVGILLCIKILVKSSCIWKLIQMFTWLIIKLYHSMEQRILNAGWRILELSWICPSSPSPSFSSDIYCGIIRIRYLKYILTDSCKSRHLTMGFGHDQTTINDK